MLIQVKKIENKNHCFGLAGVQVRGVKTLIFIFMICTQCFCQKEDYVWLGGIELIDSQTINGYVYDFNIKPSSINNINLGLGFIGNNTSICDIEGNLLFYFNGCAVINRHHQVMPNGDSINAGVWFDKFWKNCRYGYPGRQDVLILSDPNYTKDYYLFHKSKIYTQGQEDRSQLKVSYIDMKLDNGNGDLVYKNFNYYDNQDVLYFYFTAIRHKNKLDWWIVQPKINDSTFLTFLLSQNGVSTPFIQNTHQFFDDYRSSADRETSILSNHQKIEIYPQDSIDRELILFSSVEWSPNSRFIYCASSEKLHQVDTWESNIQNGVRHIDDYNGTLDPFSTRLFLMAQAPDCKIYMTPASGSYSIHVINKPDEHDKACDFVQNGIKLPAQNSGTLPNFPRFRVDEEDKCDPTITSIFGDNVYFRRDLEVYPNPSNGLLIIKISELIGDANLVVTNINGQIVYQNEIQNSIIEEVDITSMPAGRYNIEVYPIENKERIFYGKQVIQIE